MKNTGMKRTLSEISGYMKTMTFPQKISYLWYTFKVYVPIMLVIGIMVAAMVISIININTETIISGCLVNFAVSEEGHQYLTEDYGAKVGAKNNVREVQITDVYYGDPDDNSELEYNYQTSSQLYAMAAGQSLDFLLMSKQAMEILMPEEMYMDLRDILTEDELKQWEGRIVYCEFSDGRGSVPVSLDLRDTRFAVDCLAKETPYYLSFILTTPRKEACRDYLNYILAWEGAQDAAQPTTE